MSFYSINNNIKLHLLLQKAIDSNGNEKFNIAVLVHYY